MSAAELQSSVQRTAEDVQNEVKKTTPKEYGVSFAISFLFCLLYSACFRAKEQNLLNFAVFFYAIVLTLVSVVVRVKSPDNQFPWSVVLVTLIGAVYPLGNFTNLCLGAVPVAINVVRQEITTQ